MLDTLIGGRGHGFGHKDHISSGYDFEGHNEFVSHEGSGHFDRQSRYDHQMRLPANHGRPPMARMPPCDEEDSDDDEFIKRSRMNVMHPPPLAQPHHNGRHGDGYHGGHGLQQHGGHGMQQHGAHGMQQHGGHGMQQHGGHGMQHHDGHGGHGGHGMQPHGAHGTQQHGAHGIQQHGAHGMQQHGAHGMQHHDVHGGHGMQQHGAHGMKHQDRLMGPQIPPHHVYMNPSHGSGSGRTVMVKAEEKWRMSKSSGGHHKVGWGSKGL
ncbi:Uncharacterized protein HA466_0091920 [Hirschfeldia incana]|nr:Uncharacterized protein HA466_0091920 [Hirschfeldia incana]